MSSQRRESPPMRELSGVVGLGLGDLRRASLSASMASGIDALALREKESRMVDFQDNYPAIRINQMDLETQRTKLYDIRKRSSAPIFEDNNGAYYSNYLVSRMHRIVEDYRQLKYDENRGNLEQLRRSSSISAGLGMGLRSGSLNQSLNQLPIPLCPVLEGPIEVVEWFSRDNAREHRTDRYEIVSNPRKFSPVYRRGQSFFMAVKVQSRTFDLNRLPLLIYFNFGKVICYCNFSHEFGIIYFIFVVLCRIKSNFGKIYICRLNLDRRS